MAKDEQAVMMKIPQTRQTQTEPVPRLVHLPVEILFNIISVLRDMSYRESEAVAARTARLIPHVDSEKQKIEWSYAPPPEPILSSFQSFAVVNRQIHALSVPVLWERLEFPSRLPIPMTHFTENILPKHGANVKTATILLSSDWFKMDLIHSMNPCRYDNLCIIKHGREGVHTQPQPELPQDWSDHLQGLSPASVVGTLIHCPQLHKLVAYLPGPDEEEPKEEEPEPDLHKMNALATNLSKVLSTLGNLRVLELHNLRIGLPRIIFTSCITNAIRNLLLLESFSCSCISLGSEEEPKAFAEALSKLQHLTNLELTVVGALDPRWTSWPSPPKLVHLSIYGCRNLKSSEAPRTISAYAPNLTYLYLQLENHEGIETNPVNLDGSGARDDVFYLPRLIELELVGSARCMVNDCFLDCKGLRKLTYNLPENEDSILIEEFVEFICTSPFPRLTFLNMWRPASLGPLDLEKPLVTLRNYCEKHAIKLSVLELV
ncbi:hypothetical protein CROQUDRAFT_134821 [Cronartium quercuum f. sp. fusiforme G11]|uniref:F-box domain-containing protein n=1 Tax=Cronartium quercuum f. sp. fusiforme G11 TaxID=708437 RepID=A0A9P6NGD8_9BASI|nr:hypothetical protein CROQUDRAFT_134821 [Cronartium quercuum f. sp. fusiforme G11]